MACHLYSCWSSFSGRKKTFHFLTPDTHPDSSKKGLVWLDSLWLCLDRMLIFQINVISCITGFNPRLQVENHLLLFLSGQNLTAEENKFKVHQPNENRCLYVYFWYSSCYKNNQIYPGLKNSSNSELWQKDVWKANFFDRVV